MCISSHTKSLNQAIKYQNVVKKAQKTSKHRCADIVIIPNAAIIWRKLRFSPGAVVLYQLYKKDFHCIPRPYQLFQQLHFATNL